MVFCGVTSCGKKGVGDISYWWFEGFFVEEKGKEWIRLGCEGSERTRKSKGSLRPDLAH